MTNNRSVRIHGYGGSEVVFVDSIDRPSPGKDEILVRVAAAGLNPIDHKLRSGVMREFIPLSFPVTLGGEIAGTIEAVGENVHGFAKGDHVMGPTGNFGGFADFVVLDPTTLARIPDQLGDEMAAAIPVGGLTAWQGLFEHGRLEAGQTVLINGGSGGVGHFAVQLAARSGAHVIATASAANLDYLVELGAERAIDYADAAELGKIRDMDLVLDLAGQDLEILWKTLKPGGRLVSTVRPDVAHQIPSSFTGIWFQMNPDAEILLDLGRLAAGGEIAVAVSHTYAVEQAADAIEKVGASGGRGKIVLEFS